MFRWLVNLETKAKDRLCHLLWLILPKKIEEFSGFKVNYVIMPGFLIDNVLGMVYHHKKTDKVMIFIKPHKYARRFTIFHEHCEGKLFQQRRSKKQILKMTLEILQIPFSTEKIDGMEKEAKFLMKKLIVSIGEPEKIQEILKETTPEVLAILLKSIKDQLERKKPAHCLAVLQTLELAKKELSPEDFISYLYEDLGIEC